MRRKVVVRPLPVNKTRDPSLAKLAGRAHFHYCTNRECRLIYEDSCTTPEISGECRPCRGKVRPVWDADRDPQECCIDNTEQVTYRPAFLLHFLAGPGPWFQCQTCARCHGWPCTTS